MFCKVHKADMGTFVVFFSCSLCLFLLSTLIKFLHKFLWVPFRIQRAMHSQGINGPSYRFIHGNTREIISMRKDSMSRPMNLSHHIFPRLHPHIHSWFNTYGKIYLSWHGTKAQLFVIEPEFVKDILNNRDRAYSKQDTEGYLKKILGEGIVLSEGEKWTKLRKLANHAFHADRIKDMIPEMIASTEMMLERWKQYDGKEVDVFEEFKLLTSEVISITAFGSSYLEGKDIFDMLMKMFMINARNAFNIRLLGFSKLLRNADDIESDKLEQGIRDSIIRIIKQREKTVTGDGHNFGTDLLGLLVKANHDADENYRITVQDVVDECKNFYIAGQEATATLLTWTVLLLAIHTDWQEKARREVVELFGKQHPDSEGIGRLKIMNMIINESLRLYPPVPFLLRKTKHQVKMGKFIIPANTNLYVPILALHDDPQVWGEDILLFKPQRFSEGVAKATDKHQTAFLPFGLGPRSCVGTTFALNEAKIALSIILQRYSFTLSPSYIHSPIVVMTVRPQHGVQVILHAL